MLKHVLIGASAIALLTACGSGSDPAQTEETQAESQTPEMMGADTLQALLIGVEEGGVVELPEGTIQLVDGLSLDVGSVTLRGAGQDKTILDFSGQTGAGEGLLVTSDDVIIEGFTMRDTKGDGIKSKGADRITYRDLTIEIGRAHV